MSEAVARMPDNRLMQSLEKRGVPLETWRVLRQQLYPLAKKDETVLMVIDYCKARNLDPLKKPVHIVPMWNSETKKQEDTIWPGIAELLTTASRTGQFAGKDHPVFGPDETRSWGDVTVTFPQWCEVTVYKLLGGQRVPYTETVYWLEAYASLKGGAPNSMWQKRTRGQLAKCALAAALRVAFPEELGSDYAAEEMEGKTLGVATGAPRDVTPKVTNISDFGKPQEPEAPEDHGTSAGEENLPPEPEDELPHDWEPHHERVLEFAANNLNMETNKALAWVFGRKKKQLVDLDSNACDELLEVMTYEADNKE